MEIVLLFGLVIGFMLIGVPIAVSLGLSSIIFLLVFSDASLASISQTLFNAFAGHSTLLAIPFFILASTFMSTGGVARRIIRFAIACVGHLRGGLAIAAVFACMMFAALSGSSPATVVAIGSICIAAMRQVGYSRDFAAGVICNAGTLGILIPPSIVMVVYAASVDVSVGRMFLAGVFPGLIAGLMLMIGIYVAAVLRNLPSNPWMGWGEIAESTLDAIFGLLLIVIIMVGIYGIPGLTPAIFTPTEAAAVSAVYAFLVAVFVYRDMGPLRDRPWLTDGERPLGQLGFRIWSFTLVSVVLYLTVAALIPVPFWWAFVGAAVFAVLVLIASYLYVTRVDLAGAVTALYVIALGVVPGLYLVYLTAPGLYANFSSGLADETGQVGALGTVVGALGAGLISLVVIFLVAAPTVLLVYSLRTSADRLREVHGRFGASLWQGLYALGRGIAQVVIFTPLTLISRDSKHALFEAGKVTIMLMFIIANALILKHVLTEERIPQQITESLLAAGFGPVMFLVMVNVILLIGGQFMEPSGLIVIVAPLVFPIAIELGIDPIHLGIIMVVNMEIGMITPPVGLNLFVTAGVAGMSMIRVVKAALPWLAILFVFLIMITYIPDISTFLPTQLMGPELIVK